jgi:hypothetical protein
VRLMSGASMPGRPNRCSRRERQSHRQDPAGRRQRSRPRRAARPGSDHPRGRPFQGQLDEDPLQWADQAPIAKGQHIADLVVTTSDNR